MQTASPSSVALRRALNSWASEELDPNVDDQPFYDTLNEDPIRDGGVRNIYSRENIGLLFNYICTGWAEAILPATIYPFMTNYLNMDGYQTQAAFVLITFPYILKTFFAILSDCVPIMGRRRIPYLLIGWSICLCFLVICVFIPQGNGYWKHGDLNTFRGDESLRTVVNPNAPNTGFGYILLMMGATAGFCMADSAGDAVMVEFAQREPMSIRGTTQTIVTLAKFVSGGVAAAIIAVGFNGVEYGGTFNWSLNFNQVMIVAALAPVVGIATSYFIPDDPINLDDDGPACQTLHSTFIELWNAAKKRAVWQLMAFNFLNAFFFDAVAAPSDVIKRTWAKVPPIVDGVFNNIFAVFLFALAMHVTRNHFLHSDWRLVIFATTVTTVAIQWTVDFVMVFDVVRSPEFYVGVPLTYQVPLAIRNLVVTFATVEIADERFEASTSDLDVAVQADRRELPRVQRRHCQGHARSAMGSGVLPHDLLLRAPVFNRHADLAPAPKERSAGAQTQRQHERATRARDVSRRRVCSSLGRRHQRHVDLSWDIVPPDCRRSRLLCEREPSDTPRRHHVLKPPHPRLPPYKLTSVRNV
ncbi:hypothetical protein, variant 1, partial [Aphanomyces invadans]